MELRTLAANDARRLRALKVGVWIGFAITAMHTAIPYFNPHPPSPSPTWKVNGIALLVYGAIIPLLSRLPPVLSAMIFIMLGYAQVTALTMMVGTGSGMSLLYTSSASGSGRRRHWRTTTRSSRTRHGNWRSPTGTSRTSSPPRVTTCASRCTPSTCSSPGCATSPTRRSGMPASPHQATVLAPRRKTPSQASGAR